MAVTFFWRCEGTTLDGTHDHSAGDTTATANATPAIDAAAALVGSNGLLFDSAGDQYRFAPTSLIAPTVGAVGMLFRFPTAVAISGQGFFFTRGSASANDFIAIVMAASQEVNLQIRNATAGLVQLTTTTANIAAGSVYGVVIRWDQPNNKRCIEIYNSGGALIEKVEDTTTAYTAPAALDAADGLRFGDIGGSLGACHVDNCFVADAYDEPIQNNLFITSWTGYSSGVSAALTGTAVGGITEADIVSGGRTVIITLTGDTWVSN